MTEQPFKSVTYAWLADGTENTSGTMGTDFGQPGWIPYPIPPEMGHGGYELIELSFGMSLVHSTLSFNPYATGQLLPVMDVDAEFREPAFQAMASRGFHGIVTEHLPPSRIEISPGNDLFRHTSRYRSNFTVDTSFSLEACHLSIACSVLERLIGAPDVATIFDKLAISDPPAIVVRAIPLHVSNLMMQAGSRGFTGSTRRLYCQAKILEYLAALIGHFSTAIPIPVEHRRKSVERTQAIRQQLISSEGRLPSLDELACQYGRSAKLLNEEFTQEFGKSIFAFANDHRLAEAHAALLQTDVPIKQIGARLGYAHVSNFTIAFKRRFGYSPGSLRRKS